MNEVARIEIEVGSGFDEFAPSFLGAQSTEFDLSPPPSGSSLAAGACTWVAAHPAVAVVGHLMFFPLPLVPLILVLVGVAGAAVRAMSFEGEAWV